MSIQERVEIYDLFADYGYCLDEDRLEEWVDLFSADCTYKIIPRDNYDLNLPLTLMLCETDTDTGKDKVEIWVSKTESKK